MCAPAPATCPSLFLHAPDRPLARTQTVFLIAAGKTVPFGGLHMKHHAVAASIVALNIVGRHSPTPIFDGASLLNSGVHLLMYMFYTNTVFFYPIKQLITGLQLLQHILVVSAILYALDADDCDAPEYAYLPSLLLFFIWCCEFGTLYRSNYMGASEKAKAA